MAEQLNPRALLICFIWGFTSSGHFFCTSHITKTPNWFFFPQWLWILQTREQLWVCGAGGDDWPSSWVLFKWDCRTAADEWVRMSVIFPWSVQTYVHVVFFERETSVSIYFIYPIRYRKIPGDQCEGGFQPTRKEIELKRICTSNLLHQNSPVSHAHTTKKMTFDLGSTVGVNFSKAD